MEENPRGMASAGDDAVASLLALRQTLYALTARAFAAEPDDAFAAWCATEGVREAVDFLAQNFEGAIAAIDGEALAVSVARSAGDRTIGTEYTKLFVGPGAPLAPPWESVYRTGCCSKHRPWPCVALIGPRASPQQATLTSPMIIWALSWALWKLSPPARCERGRREISPARGAICSIRLRFSKSIWPCGSVHFAIVLQRLWIRALQAASTLISRKSRASWSPMMMV